MTEDEQTLKTISHACVLGLIGGRKGDHARCENRACECHCHGAKYGFAQSWRHEASA